MTFFENHDEKIIKISESGCWIWMGSLDKSGYGKVKHNKKLIGAHRVSIASETNCDISKKVVMHTCDVPCCVNPAHLKLGTIADNNADMVAKRRQMHGEKHHSAKIKSDDVFVIRDKFKNGQSKIHIAKEFNVSRKAIYDIVNKITWRHV